MMFVFTLRDAVLLVGMAFLTCGMVYRLWRK